MLESNCGEFLDILQTIILSEETQQHLCFSKNYYSIPLNVLHIGTSGSCILLFEPIMVGFQHNHLMYARLAACGSMRNVGD